MADLVQRCWDNYYATEDDDWKLAAKELERLRECTKALLDLADTHDATVRRLRKLEEAHRGIVAERFVLRRCLGIGSHDTYVEDRPASVPQDAGL